MNYKKIITVAILINVLRVGIDMIHNVDVTIEQLNNKLEKVNLELKDKEQELDIIKNNYKELETKYNDVNNKLNDDNLYYFDKVIFNANNLTELSNVNEKQLTMIFNIYPEYKNLIGLEKSIVECEETYGVNAIFILGIISQETGYNTSNRAINDNNMGGLQVYNNSSSGLSFDSKHDSIMYMGKLLSEKYLNPEGKYYRGVDIYSVNESYCVTPEDKYSWANNIINICSKYVSRINQLN